MSICKLVLTYYNIGPAWLASCDSCTLAQFDLCTSLRVGIIFLVDPATFVASELLNQARSDLLYHKFSLAGDL